MNRLASAFYGEDAKKLEVWRKGRPILGYEDTVWRHDDFGKVIRWSDYGDRSSEFGWEIDHIHPTSLGGIDHISNLRPLHHRVNSGLGGLLSGIR